MYLRPLLLALLLGAAPAALLAQAAAVPQAAQAETVSPRIKALSDTMMMSDVMSVMRDEGMDYGKTLDTELMSGAGGARWQATVGEIYDPAVMRARFDAALSAQLADAQDVLPQIEAFFGSDQGQTFLRLEIEARRALLDQDVEDAAKVSWEDMKAVDSPRLEQINRFVEANDLIESNVMGALNSNLAFYRGMGASGSFPEEMTEEQMLSDVWTQEPDIRAETVDWLYPFLALSYQPLSDDDFEAYIAFSETPAGARMNAALFAAFDVVFSQISYDLGYAAAKQMQGQDI